MWLPHRSPKCKIIQGNPLIIDDIFRRRIDHGHDLIVAEIVHLKSLGRANAAADAAPGALHLIVADHAVLVDKGRVKGAYAKAGQAGHAHIPIVF